jgi:CheY-like chemotaxis protein
VSPIPLTSGASPERRPALLVIDDEVTIRLAVRRFFERRGWCVHEARDGREGLRRLFDGAAGGAYDAIVCDLRMPGLGGVELYDRLVAEAPTLLPRLILSTGDVASPDAAAFLAAAPCPVLAKPFELTLLARTIERLPQSTPAI